VPASSVSGPKARCRRRRPPAVQFAEFIEQFAHINMQYRIVSTIFLREETHLGKEQFKKLRNFEHSFDAKLTKLVQRGIEAISRSATLD
jgi:hypothetical protein